MSNQFLQWSRIVEPQQARHGSGFLAYRLSDSSFGGLLDPILNVDHYFMSQPTFPPHPHAGFSAITYMFEDSENGMLNRDSLGNEININPGDLHWAQAGRGMLHEEPPLINGLVSHGLQIFLNLPKKLKNAAPKVYRLANSQIPRVRSIDGIAQVRVATGQFEKTLSAVQPDWPTDLLQLKWLKSGGVKIALQPGQSALILNLSENVTISDGLKSELPKYAGVAASNREATTHEFEIIGAKGSDVVVIRSQIIDEPVIFQGPFVATDAEEMNQIISRYRRGEFGTLLPRDEE